MLKKKRNLFFLLCSFLFLFLITSCGTNETSSSDNEENQAENSEETNINEQKEGETEEKLYATTIEEIIQEKSGKFAGNAYNEAIIHRTLDEESFQDKDSFQVYAHLISLLSEGESYREYYDFLNEFNASIETKISDTPGGMELETGDTIDGTANVAILLDASGSMAQKIGGKTKMELAKNAINDFLASMPEGSNVSLRVYGHKGSNDDKDKELSCASTELVYDLKPYDKGEFEQSLEKFNPTGWTPIAKAIEETKKDFEAAKKEGQNIIYVVSDGIETCDGDPVKAAKELHDSNIAAVINIIGFDVNNEGQKQLKEVAEAGGGEFKTVQSADDFNRLWEQERVRLYNEWSKWTAENYNKVASEQAEKVNELYSKRTDLSNLNYQEKSRLNEAVYYLKQTEQISSEVSEEVRSLIEQRYNIIEDFREEYRTLIDKVETEGKSLKEFIDEKGDEMKEKYR